MKVKLIFAEKLGVDKEKMLELMSKDLGLVKSEADRMETVLPLVDEANKTYISAKGKLDMAAVYFELKNRNTK